MNTKTKQFKTILKIFFSKGYLSFLVNRVLLIFRPKCLKKDKGGDYTILGDDVIPGLNEKFKNPDKSLWFNLGYWKDARNYPDACAALARYIGQKAGFNAQDEILDVGFGYAEQDVLWHNEFGVKKIIGVNITQLQVEVAKERIKKLNLSDKIELYVGSATDLRFADDSFDKIVALDCAYHFNTRDKFLNMAFRILKKGGLLVTSEVLPLSKKCDKGFLKRINRKIMQIPEANMYNKEEYVERLKHIGFGNIEFSSIRNYVFPGMFKYTEQRCRGKKLEGATVELSPHEIENCIGIELWQKVGIGDYVVFVAQKV